MAFYLGRILGATGVFCRDGMLGSIANQLKNKPMYALLLVKSVAQKYKNMPGYYLHLGHWYSAHLDKPIPKGAAIAAHPHAAGVPVPAKHFTDDQWSQLHLPAENVNAPTHNKQLQKLKELSESGDVTGILGSSYGSNTYGVKLTKVANTLLGMHGVPHKVQPGQKAGEHAAVQSSPVVTKDEAISAAIDHLTEDSKQSDMPAGEKAEDAALIAKLKTAQSVKLKQGTIALKSPIPATKSDFGDYQIHHAGIQEGSFIAAKDLTIKDGMVVGVKPALAAKLGLETVGEVQSKTALTQKKETEKAEAVAKEKASVDKQAKLIGGALGLASAVSSGKMTAADANEKMKGIKAGYDEPSPKGGDTKPAADGGMLVFKDGHWHKDMGFSSLPAYAQDLYAAAESSPVVSGNGLIECHVAVADMVSAIVYGEIKVPDGIPVLAYNYDELKGDEFNQNLKKTNPPSVKSEAASFLLEDLLDQSINGHSFLQVGDHFIDPHLKSGGTPQDEIDKIGKYLTKVFAKTGTSPNVVTPKKHQTPVFIGTSKLSQIPWDKQYLPESNSNAPSHNKAVTKIKAMADAGDVAGLQAFVDSKANAKQNYAKKQGLLAKVALAALTEGDDAPADPAPVAVPAAPAAAPKVKKGKFAEMVAESVDGAMPDMPVFKDYDYASVGKKWNDLLSAGSDWAFFDSINALTATVKTKPFMAKNEDVQKLLKYALDLTKWNNAKKKTSGDAAAVVAAPAPAAPSESDYEMFHNTTEGHNKFWAVAVVGNKVYKKWGAIGTKGQSLIAEFSSPEAAKKAANKDKAVKKGNGYNAMATDDKSQTPLDGWVTSVSSGIVPTGAQVAAFEKLSPNMQSNWLQAAVDNHPYKKNAAWDEDSTEAAMDNILALHQKGVYMHDKATAAAGIPVKPTGLSPSFSGVAGLVEEKIKQGDKPALISLKDLWAHKEGDQTQKIKDYIDAGIASLGGDDSPKEGETKQGANGVTLVFKNGRWHKQGGGDPILDKWADDLAAGKPPTFEDAQHVQSKYFDEGDMDAVVDVLGYSFPDMDSMEDDEGNPLDVLDYAINLHQKALASLGESDAGDDGEDLDSVTVPDYDAFSGGSSLQSDYAAQFLEESEGLLAYAKLKGSAGLAKYVTMNPNGTISVDSQNGFKVSLMDYSDSFADMKLAKYKRLNAMYHFVKKLMELAPDTAAPSIPSMAGWTQTGPQQGSNDGGRFRDENGVEWYCKFPKSEAIAKSEVLAANLYALAGVAGQDAKLVERHGVLAVASRWQSVNKASASVLAATEGTLDGFGADAWLANWDVVGIGNDNLQIGANGKAVRIDAGGALMYRAQGGKKAFGDNVSELDSLRDKAINPHAAAVFGKMSKADITASIAKVVGIKNSDIKSLVEKYGPGSVAEKKALYDTLVARKNDMLAKYPKAATPPKKRLDPTKLPVKEQYLPKAFDFNTMGAGDSPLSSKPGINAANNEAISLMRQVALAGNLTALKDFKFPVFDKSSGTHTGEYLPIDQHPSKHVIQYHEDLVDVLSEIADPPKPLVMTNMLSAGTIDELNAAFPPKKFGTTVASVKSNEKLGFWLALGGITGDVSKLRPKKISDYSAKSIAAGYQKFKDASKLARHFIERVQYNTTYNYLFRNGKKKDHEGNDLKDVAQAALEHSSTQPEGTSVYRWQHMTDSMVKKILLAADGTVFQANGPMCTSYDPYATQHFGTHRLVIRYAKGARGVDTFGSGGYVTEKEITTLPNARFVILSKNMVNNEKSAGGKRLELELLMLPPDLAL